MEEVYALASERVGQKASKSKHHYDIKVRSPILSPGDHVLVRNLGERPQGNTEPTGKIKCILLQASE